MIQNHHTPNKKPVLQRIGLLKSGNEKTKKSIGNEPVPNQFKNSQIKKHNFSNLNQTISTSKFALQETHHKDQIQRKKSENVSKQESIEEVYRNFVTQKRKNF